MNVENLRSLADAHRAAGATAYLGLMDAAVATADEAVCASVLAHVEARTPKETTALAAITKELDSDRRHPPALFAEIDLAIFSWERLVRVAGGGHVANLQYKDPQSLPASASVTAHVAGRWRFRRESQTFDDGAGPLPLAARLLIPAGAGVDSRRLEAFGREFSRYFDAGANAGRNARAAMLAAAAERNAR